MAHNTDIASSLGQITLDSFKGDEAERIEVIEEAKKLLSRLQRDVEKAYDITFSQPIVFASLQICLDIGLWSGWAEAGGGVMSVDILSTLCKRSIEPNLLRRMLRLLASTYIIEETAEDNFKMTSFSLCLGNRETFIPNVIQCSTYHWSMNCLNLPKFLAKTNYVEPRDADACNYKDWCPEKLDFFGKCSADPVYQDAFSGFMRAWTKYKLPWPEFFDTDSLLHGANLASAPLLVDIGGHHGADITRLLDKHPDLPAGSLVLQDLPACISEVGGLSDKITPMAIDMFESQPVKGARAYHFHAVFHDWPDDVCLKILGLTAAAMKKGYSKLLINEIAIPPQGASWIQTSMDMEMMAIFSAKERSEQMWRELLSEAGFEIVKFWRDGLGLESLIEAQLL